MNDSTFLLIVVVIGVATYLLRFSFIGAARHEPRAGKESAWQRALRYVPVAVLSALIAPALSLRSGALALPWQNPRLIAGLVAALVAWRTRNVLATLAVGMALLWLLQALG